MQFVPCTFAQPLECKQGRIGESYSRSPLRKETYSQLDGMADTYLSSPHAWVVHTSFSPPDRAGEDDRRPWGSPVGSARGKRKINRGVGERDNRGGGISNTVQRKLRPK